MKNRNPLFLAFVLAVSAYAQPQQSSTLAQASFDTEAKDLARSYAKAFGQLSRTPLTIAFQKDGILRMLDDVKKVREADGVLVVEVSRGMLFIINPKDIVYISEGRVAGN